MVKKHPKSSLKSYFLLIRKHLKFDNSRATNQTHVKFGTEVVNLDTFHLLKNVGVEEWGSGYIIQKNTKKCHKINISRLYHHHLVTV